MNDFSDERPPLLDVLSVGPVGVTSPSEVERARREMLPWLEEQVGALPQARSVKLRHERHRRIAAFSGGFAVAAAAVLALVFRAPEPKAGSQEGSEAQGRSSRATATLVTGKLSSHSDSWTFGQEVELSGRLEAGPEGAALQAEGGYQLELRPSASISFEQPEPGKEPTAGFRLHHGVAKISVLPLPQGSKLVVRTGDVLLTVVQSAFTIQAEEGKPSCVRVSEGKVTVRHGEEQVEVGAGETFGCSDPQEERAETSTVDAPRKTTPGPRTTLSQENALLARALAAESRRDMSEARRAYVELLAKYPRSAFAQDARAGLERVSR